jgi:hypothetical protein
MVAEDRRGCEGGYGHQAGAGRSAALQVVAEALRETAERLEPLLPRLTAPDMRDVYFQVVAASQRQLRVVQAWSAR